MGMGISFNVLLDDTKEYSFEISTDIILEIEMKEVALYEPTGCSVEQSFSISND